MAGGAKLSNTALKQKVTQARLIAAEERPELLNRAVAADLIGVSLNSLANYENGKQSVPLDVLMRMAIVYKTPMLVLSHCTEDCPIGSCMFQPYREMRIEGAACSMVAASIRLVGEHEELLDITKYGDIRVEDRERFLNTMVPVRELTSAAWHFHAQEMLLGAS